MAKRRRGRGEGGVEQLPSGSWRAVTPARTDPATGKRVRESKTFPTKPEALTWLAQQTAAPKPVASGTVGEWLDKWLESHARRVAPKTLATDRWTVDKYLRPAFGADKLRTLESDDIERKIAALPCSVNEQHKAARTLRNALNAAVRAKVLSVSPMGSKKVVMPRRKVKENRSLTEAELARLLAHTDATKYGPAIRLWIDAGMRPSEALGLQWGDLDLDAGTVHIRRAVCPETHELKAPKTKKSVRKLPLAASTVAALRTLTREGDGVPLLHAAPKEAGGSPLHWWLSNFSDDVFRPLVKAAGVVCHPYTLRHTCATLLLRAGVSLKVVSERLGHEDVTETLRSYAHSLPDEQHRAAKALDSILPTLLPTPPETA